MKRTGRKLIINIELGGKNPDYHGINHEKLVNSIIGKIRKNYGWASVSVTFDNGPFAISIDIVKVSWNSLSEAGLVRGNVLQYIADSAQKLK